MNKPAIHSLVNLQAPADPQAPPSAPANVGGPATFSFMIVAKVRAALFERKIGPGDFLGSEKEIAKEFGVSRTTARDALRTLEAMGIVEIRVGAGGGARIAAGNLDRFADALAVQMNLAGVTEHEIIDAQKAVEVMGAELACDNATEEDLARLGGLLDAAAGLIDSANEFTAASWDFHLAVSDASHNRALSAQLKALRFVVWPAKDENMTREVALHVLAIHREIHDLIKAGDGEAAGRVMRAHLQEIGDKKSSRQSDRNWQKITCC